MTLNHDEYEAIIRDTSKRIAGDIRWEGGASSSSESFRISVDSDEGYPLFVKGWFNPNSGKLSFAIIHSRVGRIYGLDLGAEHRNPDGDFVGEKHKNYWKPGCRDKWAFIPEDITATWDQPVLAWQQFCREARLDHRGRLYQPAVQIGLPQ